MLLPFSEENSFCVSSAIISCHLHVKFAHRSINMWNKTKKNDSQI